MSDALKTSIHDYLQSHRGMVFASTADGEQIASTTCFVADEELQVYGFVFKNSDKFHAVESGAPITLTIDDGFQIPMKGLEYHGRGEFVADGAETQRTQELLQERFPKLANVWGHPAIVLVRVIPERIVFIDWSVSLGHSETLEFASA